MKIKRGTYIASTEKEGGAVMFRVDGVAYTLRKGSDIEVELTERSKVIYPSEFMSLKLKSESKQKEAKKEIKKEELKKAPKEEVKEEPKKDEEPKKTASKSTRGRRKTVKIETEEK